MIIFIATKCYNPQKNLIIFFTHMEGQTWHQLIKELKSINLYKCVIMSIFHLFTRLFFKMRFSVHLTISFNRTIYFKFVPSYSGLNQGRHTKNTLPGKYIRQGKDTVKQVISCSVSDIRYVQYNKPYLSRVVFGMFRQMLKPLLTLKPPLFWQTWCTVVTAAAPD